ncbi:MAG: TIM barrel protein, partial [Planctomycetota bacterium]
LIENEPKFWCDTSANTLKILESVNSPYLKSNWDPANAFAAGESPYPEGYNQIKKFIANIHIKDILEDTSKKCVVVGDGVIDWPGQLGTIIKDKLLNHVTIETHCLPLIEKSKENLKRVNKIIASARGGSVSGTGN